ncbi:hypothetical protein T061_22230 [Salmonella enterica subsp. arizonae]|nr:hypothetical protein [Salmonella enterica subsp. arizonae]
MNKRIFVTAKSVVGICILAALTTQSARAGQLVLASGFTYSYKYEYLLGAKVMYPGGSASYRPAAYFYPDKKYNLNNAKITPSHCYGNITTYAGESSAAGAVTSSVSCLDYYGAGLYVKENGNHSVSRKNGYAQYEMLQGGGRSEFNTEHDAVDIIACVTPERGQFTSTFPGNRLTFTSPDGKVYTTRFSSVCSPSLRLPATNSPSGALTLNYEDQITANAKPDGSFEHRLLSLDNSTRGSLKLNMSATSAQGAIASARLVKANGAPCDTISAGETCSFSLPPGSVGVGQTLQGNITVNASVI